jgi:cold shock CspA family protein
MRFYGTLARWNSEREFGFILPIDGGEELFAHISSFPRDGQRPQINEKFSFEVALGKGGKKQAVAIRRAATEAAVVNRPQYPAQPQASHHVDPSTGFGSKLLALLLIGALLAVGYWKYDQRQATQANATAAEVGDNAPVPLRSTPTPEPLVSNNNNSYRCDGRQHCSQMTSCAEATFFLKNCPGTQMDGNNDGVPCEQQWCR